jgi:hypothetical protein
VNEGTNARPPGIARTEERKPRATGDDQFAKDSGAEIAGPGARSRDDRADAADEHEH